MNDGVDSSRAHRTNETRRARGDFPTVNRSRMVSFSRADKKKEKEDKKVIKTKICHQIYLGGCKYNVYVCETLITDN